ncbi:hypothetical protein OKA04_02465 [Luteolibacter flavescens]|uniref:YtxH domain-containing protein n=1 Tax=Luteolibacter flavescens TaxID=1859460 RepID=A0ABT3FJ31_9BACT|nr:hypothetical protein [Luteolibacter flavescens]MCW1883573.1 hypothetical protein [Luteolibacter flavescens]
MRTQKFPQTQNPEHLESHAERNGSQNGSHDVSTRHAHWDDLHSSSNGTTRHFLTNLRHEISRRPWTDIAVAAAAGFAAGWLLSGRHRSHAVRDLFLGSLLPAASKKVHHAYDAIRDNGSLREIGHQFDKLKSRW